MGCHTWFYRPLSSDEIENAKPRAIEMAYNLCGDTDENREFNSVDLILQDKVIESVKNNTKYWIDNGWGFDDLIMRYQNQYYLCVNDFHDVFRVINYPSTVLKGFKNTLRFLRKKGKQYERKYKTLKNNELKIDVEITEERIKLLKDFFHKYNGGLIKFG